MLVIISSAKTLDFESEVAHVKLNKPKFYNESIELIQELAKKSSEDLMSLMKVSRKIADLNKDRFKELLAIQITKSKIEIKERAAIFAYAGDVYEALAPQRLDKKSLDFLNSKLRIVSGLYGILNPFDKIAPYRLEMSAKLKTNKGKNLYDFWGDKLAKDLLSELSKIKHDDERFLVNLASQEYSEAIKFKTINCPKIQITFKEYKNKKYQVIGVLAKKARGLMLRYIAENKISKPKDLKNFNCEAYAYDTKLSSESEFVFVRKHK